MRTAIQLLKAMKNGSAKLEKEKIILSERIEKCGRTPESFERSLRTPLEFLSNPWNLWETGKMEHRQTVLKLAFDDNLSYMLGEGFRTPNIALPFKALEDIRSGNFEMAHRGKIRTPDPVIRSHVLYPAELPVPDRVKARRTPFNRIAPINAIKKSKRMARQN